MNENYFSLDRKKNTIRNTKWGIANKLLILLFPFVIRTCLIYKIGIDYTGLNSLFSSILSIINLAELGVSSAIAYSMYKPIALMEKNKICALLNFYKKAYYIIGIAVLILGLAIFPFIKYFVYGTIPSDINIYFIYLIFLIQTVLGYFPFSYKNCLLSSHQREDVISRNTSIINIFIYIIQILIILLLKNYYFYVITIPLMTIFINLINYYSATKLFPEYKPYGILDKETRENLKKNIYSLMISKIGGSTRNNLDSIIISSFFGLSAVTIYNNYFFVILSVNGLLGVLASSILAGVGNKIVIESSSKNYNDFKRFHFFYMWISGWCMVCMLNLFQPFMRLWVGDKLLLPYFSVLLLCYYFLMLKQGDINSVYYQATGLWYYGRWRFIVEAFLNLILNIILGRLFGINGIIIATIISFTIIYFYGSSFVFTKYFKNKKILDFYFDNVFYLIVSFFVGFLFCNIFSFLSIQNVITEFLIKLLICCVFPNLIFLLIFLLIQEKRKYILDLYNMLRIKVK